MRSLDPSVNVNIHIDENYASSQAGGLFATEFAKQGITQGKVILITGDKDHPNAHHRTNGIVARLELMDIDSMIFYSEDWLIGNSETEVRKEVEKNPEEIVGMFSGFALASQSMIDIMKDYNLDFFSVGFDLSDQIKKEILNGRISAVIYQNPEGIGKRAIETIGIQLRPLRDYPR